MKIAIQLFGHLRSYKYTKDYLYKNLINHNKNFGFEFDIFIHSWDEKDSKNNASYKKAKNFIGKKFHKKEINGVKSFYNAKLVSITPQIELSEEDYKASESSNVDIDLIQRNKNLSFSIKSVNELRKSYENNNNISYDLVILTRSDIMFIEKINLSSFKKNLIFPNTPVSDEYMKKIVCSSYIIFSDLYNGAIIDSKNYICGIDLFLITNAKNASTISSWYDNRLNNPNLWPEFALTKIIKDNNLEHRYISCEKDKHWMILRNNFYYTSLKIFSPIRVFFDLLFISLTPIMLMSLKFRKMMMINPHYLDSNNIKKLLRFFFPKK